MLMGGYLMTRQEVVFIADQKASYSVRPSMHQPIEYKGANTPPARNPTACYMDRKPEIRILCGSV
jgi:hypothetical protein